MTEVKRVIRTSAGETAIYVNTELLLADLQSSKLDNNNDNHFKEAYNTGIDVAIGTVERWKNIEGVSK